MTQNEEYKALLRDPKWVAFRGKILARDNNRCTKCGAMGTLNAHHKFYFPGAKPWEYPDSALVTLCRACHQGHHKEEDERVALIEKREFERETQVNWVAPTPPQPSEAGAVGIYRLVREWATYAWLCARHLAVRVADRWTAERTGDVRGFGCDDCETERQQLTA